MNEYIRYIKCPKCGLRVSIQKHDWVLHRGKFYHNKCFNVNSVNAKANI